MKVSNLTKAPPLFNIQRNKKSMCDNSPYARISCFVESFLKGPHNIIILL